MIRLIFCLPQLAWTDLRVILANHDVNLEMVAATAMEEMRTSTPGVWRQPVRSKPDDERPVEITLHFVRDFALQ